MPCGSARLSHKGESRVLARALCSGSPTKCLYGVAKTVGATSSGPHISRCDGETWCGGGGFGKRGGTRRPPVRRARYTTRNCCSAIFSRSTNNTWERQIDDADSPWLIV